MLELLTALVLIASALTSAAAEPEIEARFASAGHRHTLVEADETLSLREVVLYAVEREPGSLAVTARREEATELRRIAARLLAGAPTISANHATDGLMYNDGYRRWDVGLRLPLWWPGQRKGRRTTARAAESAATEAKRAHALEVAGWVRRAISDLALSHIRLALTEAEWRAELALAAQIERAVTLEERANRELLLARSASLDRRLLYLEALEESRHAEGNYFLLTGLARWPAQWSETPADSHSLENHPLMLLAAKEIVRAQGELSQLASNQWGNPVLALGSEHERNADGENFNDRIVAGFTIPLGRRSTAQANVAAARRRLAGKRRDRQRLERKLRGQLSTAEHRFALSNERVATAAEQAKMAAEYLRLTELGFGLGEADLGELLRARTRATAAEQTRREALILRQTTAGELNQTLGVLP